VFYTLDGTPSSEPRFERRDAVCFSCHAPQNGGVPGMMVTSVFPAADGMPFAGGQFFPVIDHRSPLEERWGGWYVTGTHGSQSHRGNAVARDPNRPADLETEGTQNLTNLAGKFDIAAYLTGASDIVALMTLEHQSSMTNFIVRLGQATRTALRDGTVAGAGGKKLDALADQMAAYMLFAGEAPLKEPIHGNTTFAKTFAQRGPRDSKGRSLRDFDLTKWMFRYPLSYMIYTEAFDGNPKFARLSIADRTAVLEILRETKPTLPDYWKR
jgi:hypothetical protein